jgi:hypothetical protein
MHATVGCSHKKYCVRDTIWFAPIATESERAAHLVDRSLVVSPVKIRHVSSSDGEPDRPAVPLTRGTGDKAPRTAVALAPPTREKEDNTDR